jgi:hypothetical protein
MQTLKPFFSGFVHVVNEMIFFDVAIVSKSNVKSKNRQYSYSEVLSITNNLNTIIGRGGFGSVYLGTLKDDTQVAVKFLSPQSNQGYKEFQAEVR